MTTATFAQLRQMNANSIPAPNDIFNVPPQRKGMHLARYTVITHPYDSLGCAARQVGWDFDIIDCIPGPLKPMPLPQCNKPIIRTIL